MSRSLKHLWRSLFRVDSTRPAAFRPSLEVLEERRVMTTANLAGGVLRVVGTLSPEAIQVRRINDLFTVSGVVGAWSASQVQRIEIDAHAGNDTINLNSGAIAGEQPLGKPCVVRAGLGNDTIYGSDAADSLFGELGDDRVYGNAGADFIDGGAGNDFLYGDTGNDKLYGDIGNDSLYGNDGVDQLGGGAGNDNLFGGLGGDSLDGGAGADSVFGEGDYDISYIDRADSRRTGIEYFDSTPAVWSWFDRNIDDANLRTAARWHYSGDSQINRGEMLDLFARVRADGTVSSTEFVDLKDFVGVTYLMPAHVHNLANKVINGDRANNWYQGQTLGNLASGAPAARLEKLVNKWFLGLDRPIAESSDGDITYSYELAAGTLFRQGPSYLDIDQGRVGDCYFLTALGTVAQHTPGVINNMFIDNGDGTFSVRFYRNNNGEVRPEYVTVDRYLPIESDYDFHFGNRDSSFDANGNGVFESSEKLKFYSPENELWVALAEKAYAQLNESGWIGQNDVNSYQGIRYGQSGKAMTHVSGRLATEGGHPMFFMVVSFCEQGRLLTVSSKDWPPDSRVVADHSYMVVGYNASTERFTLFNPHGVFSDADDPTFLVMSWSQIVTNFGSWDYSHS